jgi:hypothetical protein
MSDSRWSQTERDEDAYEDAWYRALKAKSEHRFPDPEQERAEAPPPPPERSDAED